MFGQTEYRLCGYDAFAPSRQKRRESVQGYGKVCRAGQNTFSRSFKLYIEEIDDFIAQIDIMSALIQNEIHIYYQEQEVVPYMHELGIVMQAWYPFGGRGHTGEQLADQTIVEIALAHNVTSAQVILRWHLQRGVVAIPGSSNPDHIEENISVFHFSLTDEEIARISVLDRGEKHDWY